MSVLQKYSKSSIIEESKARQVCGMKDQITLTDVEYGNRKKTTKREEFLNFQRALNRGDMETCRRFCERWNVSDVFNAFLARSRA